MKSIYKFFAVKIIVLFLLRLGTASVQEATKKQILQRNGESPIWWKLLWSFFFFSVSVLVLLLGCNTMSLAHNSVAVIYMPLPLPLCRKPNIAIKQMKFIFDRRGSSRRKANFLFLSFLPVATDRYQSRAILFLCANFSVLVCVCRSRYSWRLDFARCKQFEPHPIRDHVAMLIHAENIFRKWSNR